MHVNVYDVFYSLNSHQNVSATIAAIFRVLLLLREYEDTNVVIHVAGNP
jgi:hypothetical protein